jgi:hypothetical protein
MTADRSWIEENTEQRERLRALIRRASDGDLARPLAAGWTVAAALAHLAFWDQRIAVLLDAWDRGRPPTDANEADVDWINDSAKALCLALAPRAAAELALATAEAVDALVAALGDDRLAANAAAGAPINVRRSEHRREHLDEIEQALASRPAGPGT